jgi:hypothetical protein
LINKKNEDYYLNMDFIFRTIDRMVELLNNFENIFSETVLMRKFYKNMLKSKFSMNEYVLGFDIDDVINWKDIFSNLHIYRNYYDGLKMKKFRLDEERVYFSNDVREQEKRITNVIDFDSKVRLLLEKAHNVTEIYRMRSNQNIEKIHNMMNMVDVLSSNSVDAAVKKDVSSGTVLLNDIQVSELLRPKKVYMTTTNTTGSNRTLSGITGISVGGVNINVKGKGSGISIGLVGDVSINKNIETSMGHNNVKTSGSTVDSNDSKKLLIGLSKELERRLNDMEMAKDNSEDSSHIEINKLVNNPVGLTEIGSQPIQHSIPVVTLHTPIPNLLPPPEIPNIPFHTTPILNFPPPPIPCIFNQPIIDKSKNVFLPDKKTDDLARGILGLPQQTDNRNIIGYPNLTNSPITSVSNIFAPENKSVNPISNNPILLNTPPIPIATPNLPYQIIPSLQFNPMPNLAISPLSLNTPPMLNQLNPTIPPQNTQIYPPNIGIQPINQLKPSFLPFNSAFPTSNNMPVIDNKQPQISNIINNPNQSNSSQPHINNLTSNPEYDPDDDITFLSQNKEVILIQNEDEQIKKHTMSEIKQSAKSFIDKLKIKLQADIDNIKVNSS